MRLTAVGNHCLAVLLTKYVCFQQSHTAKRLLRSSIWTLEDSLPCYCYAIKTNSRTICSQVSQPASAGKGADMSEMQTHRCMTSEQWTWLMCNMSILLANKLLLQELNQLNEINCWLQVLQKFVVLRPNFQGGQMPIIPPLRTPMPGRCCKTTVLTWIVVFSCASCLDAWGI